MAAPLTIRIKKKPDGSAALSCQRADGSVTWQRQTGPQGAFFPLHDLTHYAVETELGLEQAFSAARHEHGGDVRLTDTELHRIRTTRHALFDRWRALPPGETLELSFPAGQSP